MQAINNVRPMPPQASAETPALRLFALLEVISASDHEHSLQSLVEETGLPKATLHRMLQQLEAGELLLREGDSRRWGIGARLRRLAETLLLNDTRHGARRAILRRLVERVGETCNITTMVGGEVVYLDRVETAAPLRFSLRAGSRVPVHCSASGKMLLSQMDAAQRRRLLAHMPLEPFTASTLTSLAALEGEIEQASRDGHAFDKEEFLPGLMCIAMLVPVVRGRSNLCVAIQAPTVRATPQKALQWLPALSEATAALGGLEDGSR